MFPELRLAPVGHIGRYAILGRLASGGMADVYLAVDDGPRDVRRYLVVKRVRPHVADDTFHVESFVQEARLSMRLRHPNICTVYEFGEDEGAYFLAMEYVFGVSLKSLYERARGSGGLPIEAVARIGAEVSDALRHAHEATDDAGLPLHIVHRDVTPENIMIGFDGVVKLLDFGIAKARGQQVKTQQGELKGKFAYMSPEQYDAAELDGRTDVFALGVCLHEALAGQSLFGRPSELQTVTAIIADTEGEDVREVRADVLEPFAGVIAYALHRRLDERTESADVMHRQIVQFEHDHGGAMGRQEMADLVRGLFPNQAAAPPELDRTPLEASRGPDTMSVTQRAEIEHALDDLELAMNKARRRRGALLGFGLLLLIAAAVGGILWRVQGGGEAVDAPAALSPE